MPFASFNVGRDVTVTFTNPLTQQPVTWGLVTEFTSRPNTKQIVSNPLSAPPQFADPPDGWDGSFTVDRNSSQVDDLFAALENNYWNGNVIPNATIIEYVTEIAGNTTSYQYTNVSLKLDDAGNKRSQEKITMKISFKASQRLKLT